MSNDLAFDAYDRLVGRVSLADSPISLVVRNPNPEKLGECVERCLDLFRGRKLSDEMLIVVSTEPPARPPSRIGAVAIRTVVHSNAERREGVEWVLANARWPVAAFVGADAELPGESLRAMLKALEHADVVVGRRRNVRGRRNPMAWWVRRLFGVGVSDPLSPFLALRRESAAGVPLQLDAPLSFFDLYAKLTYAFAMYDEIEVPLDSPDEPLHRVLLKHRSALATLFWRPQLWRYSKDVGRIRLPPQETRPPGVVERRSDAMVNNQKQHPWQPPSFFARARMKMQMNRR